MERSFRYLQNFLTKRLNLLCSFQRQFCEELYMNNSKEQMLFISIDLDIHLTLLRGWPPCRTEKWLLKHHSATKLIIGKSPWVYIGTLDRVKKFEIKYSIYFFLLPTHLMDYRAPSSWYFLYLRYEVAAAWSSIGAYVLILDIVPDLQVCRRKVKS